MRPDAGKLQRQWQWVAAARALAPFIGVAGVLFGLVALAGYLWHMGVLYRPIAGGPATAPLTAVSILCLGISISLGADTLSRRAIWLKRSLLLYVALMTVLRLAQIMSGIDLTSWLIPFYSQVLRQRHMGMSDSMGGNTALMLLTVSISLGLHCWGLPKISQIAAGVAVAIPGVSFLGYLYGHAHFYGHMSLLSAISGFCLALGALVMTADRWMLAAVLSPYLAGKIARAQLLAGILAPTLLGLLLVKLVDGNALRLQEVLALLIACVCAFVSLMIGVSAIFQERTDFLRRQSESRLAELAQFDTLTGTPNRRRFFEIGLRECERIKRHGGILWVLMIDIDYFKRINDIAGHGMGDQVLVAIGSLLSHSVRKTDVVGRLGGEEFAMVLTDTNRDGCARIAEGLRQKIELLDVAGWTEIHGPITASMGCARLSAEDTLENALSRADAELYRAKRSGRNRVCFGETLDGTQGARTQFSESVI